MVVNIDEDVIVVKGVHLCVVVVVVVGGVRVRAGIIGLPHKKHTWWHLYALTMLSVKCLQWCVPKGKGQVCKKLFRLARCEFNGHAPL